MVALTKKDLAMNYFSLGQYGQSKFTVPHACRFMTMFDLVLCVSSYLDGVVHGWLLLQFMLIILQAVIVPCINTYCGIK